MKNTILTLVFAILILSSNFLFSQNFNCIPNYIPGQWQNQVEQIQDNTLGLIGSVSYEKRGTGSNIDVAIDWNSLLHANPALSIDAVKQLIEYNIARKLIDCPLYLTEEYTKTVSFYYTTKCTYEKVSIMKLDHNNFAECCDDPTINPLEGKYTYNNEWFEKIVTIEDCGTVQCCKKVYTVRCKLVEYDFQGQLYYYGETEVDPLVQKFVITPCTDPNSGLLVCPNPPVWLPPTECTGGC